MKNFKVEIIDPIENELDSNTDVQIKFADGRRYIGTFFTVANIQRIMKDYEDTGECLHGMYFWCTDMIIVQNLKPETIEATVQEIIAQDELDNVFLRCVPEEETED